MEKMSNNIKRNISSKEKKMVLLFVDSSIYKIQWFSIRSDFDPQKTVAKSGDISGCHNSQIGCYWDLAGRGQGCC